MLWFKAHFSRLPKYLSSLRKFKLPCPGTALSLCPFVRSLWNIKCTCFIRSLWFSLVLVWTVFKFIFRKRRSYFSGTFYNGRTLRLISGRPWVAVIHKTSKTAPQSSPNNVYPMSRTFSFLFSKYLDTKFYGIPGFIQWVL